MPAANENSKPWIVTSLRLVAEFFGVSYACVANDWRARGMPWEQGRFDLREVMLWRERDKASRPRARDDSGDPELDGAESEGLERYRMAKAQLAELELGRRRGDLVDRDIAHTGLGRVADILRNCGQQIERSHGPEAAQVLADALKDMEREIEIVFGLTDTDGYGNGTAESADTANDGQRGALVSASGAGSASANNS